jgi:site-specific DNA-methyltransferase (adenine-specific)
MANNHIFFGDNLEILKSIPDDHVNMIYIDPPFNTGRAQARIRMKTVRDEENGDRVGFKGQKYRTIKIGSRSYNDTFDDYLGFLEPRLIEAKRVLAPDGVFFFHIDYREVHYCKVMLDQIFGRESFVNEIIWAYDYGARSKSRWPAKHDNILFYAKNPESFVFDLEACDRIAYMAPGLVGEEKAERGKTPTDVWWHTIVSPTGREKTGYPTQKPLGIMRRLIKVHTRPGDLVMDFFAGSGSTGVAAAELGRRFIMCDQNPEAIAVMKMRVAEWETHYHNCEEIAAVERNGYVAPADAPPAAQSAGESSNMNASTVRKGKTCKVPPKTAFHALLRKTMSERSMTTGGLARATEVSFPTAQKILGGTLPGRHSTAEAFARYLGIDLAEMKRLMSEQEATRNLTDSNLEKSGGSFNMTEVQPVETVGVSPSPSSEGKSIAAIQLSLF